MERWKDMFYNKNDIFLALVILLVAGFVIFDRVEAIMEYPQAQALEQEQDASPPAEQSPPADTATTPEAKPVDVPTQEETPDQTQQPAAQQPAQPPIQQVSKIQIDIPSGTTEATVGKMLVEKGFISDKSSFIQALEAAGKTGKVQAGKFTIPSDATMDQIIDIFTN